jgi:hypothetical protein
MPLAFFVVEHKMLPLSYTFPAFNWFHRKFKNELAGKESNLLFTVYVIWDILITPEDADVQDNSGNLFCFPSGV